MNKCLFYRKMKVDCAENSDFSVAGIKSEWREFFKLLLFMY